ncbi:NuoI/complex I 23 kDa subunit family protein [Persicirhabdus sediminis]|uniref:NADH-quinone oxidoreductase subunit I n=1 Tax=Persicirhabdus sediminis TaxID=454144 RepID=A0A8J7MBL2_9BACT|nr:NADH-quinone oxidoreductase subunit I [Persicirhabdus sediminis]MBK1789996.1 NADH-quinone oxidoreductase subunit I [Persicirhabdus sediminis]
MAIKKLTRPKLTLSEKLIFPTILKGMAVTMTHAIKSVLGKTKAAESLKGSGTGATMQYPETKWDDQLPEYYRGVPALVTDEIGRERCVSCQLCEFICPPKAISILPGEIPSDDEWAKVEKRPQEFDIDMTRCIYCGMCEEVCPEQAIFLRQDYAVTGTSRENMVHNKERLYEIGGVREGLVNKWNEVK